MHRQTGQPRACASTCTEAGSSSRMERRIGCCRIVVAGQQTYRQVTEAAQRIRGLLQIIAAETIVIEDIAGHEHEVSLSVARHGGDGAHCLETDQPQLGSPLRLQVTQLQTELPIRRMNEPDHQIPRRSHRAAHFIPGMQNASARACELAVSSPS